MYACAVGIKSVSALHHTSFAALLNAAYRKFPSHPPQYHIRYLYDRCIGQVFHTCQSPTLQNCFGQVMHNLGNRVAVIFSSLDFSIPQSLVQTLEFGIVLTLVIVRIVQGLVI